MTAPLVTHRGWWRQIRDDLAPYLPRLIAVAVGAAVAAVWTRVLDWPVIGLAILGLSLIAIAQEGRLLSLHSRLEDHLVESDERRGPIAPAYDPEPPWMPAPPVKLAPIEPFGSGTTRPSPFPAQPKTEPVAVPEAPATVPAGVAVDAEWAQVMADADAYIAELRG